MARSEASVRRGNYNAIHLRRGEGHERRPAPPRNVNATRIVPATAAILRFRDRFRDGTQVASECRFIEFLLGPCLLMDLRAAERIEMVHRVILFPLEKFIVMRFITNEFTIFKKN